MKQYRNQYLAELTWHPDTVFLDIILFTLTCTPIYYSDDVENMCYCHEMSWKVLTVIEQKNYLKTTCNIAFVEIVYLLIGYKFQRAFQENTNL